MIICRNCVPLLQRIRMGLAYVLKELRGWLKVTPRRVTYAPPTSNKDLSPGAPVTFIFRPHFFLPSSVPIRLKNISILAYTLQLRTRCVIDRLTI